MIFLESSSKELRKKCHSKRGTFSWNLSTENPDLINHCNCNKLKQIGKRASCNENWVKQILTKQIILRKQLSVLIKNLSKEIQYSKSKIFQKNLPKIFERKLVTHSSQLQNFRARDYFPHPDSPCWCRQYLVILRQTRLDFFPTS